MAKEDLIPFNKRTEAERKEISRRAGKRSGEVRRQQKTFREIGETLCRIRMQKGKAPDLEKIKEVADLAGANMTIKECMLVQQILKALEGDTKAFETVRDTIGEKPSEKVEVEATEEKFTEVLDMWNQNRMDAE